MEHPKSRVTIHMVASLDGFIARRDGSVGWLETSVMPVLIGDGVSFFEGLDKDVALHLVEAKAYDTGMVALHYEVRMWADWLRR